jgi:energy-coupling factor transport system ATP-binding protein
MQLAQTMVGLKAQGHTLIIAEHRLYYLTDIADRFLYMENGQITKSYTKTELLALPGASRKRMGIRSPQKTECPKLPHTAACGQSPSVALENLAYRVKGKDILEEVSLSAYPGQILAITGKNGAGKTTLAKLVCGLLKGTRGQIRFAGKQIGVKRRWEKAWYGANDTNVQFFTESVAKEVLLLSPQTHEAIERAREVLKAFSLYEYKDRHPATLSGGEKQRLSLACGLFCGRDILILDEPTSGLDGQNMRLVSKALQYAAAQGKTIFLITHDYELVSMCCTNVYQLN